jgi:hypothetical protein
LHDWFREALMHTQRWVAALATMVMLGCGAEPPAESVDERADALSAAVPAYGAMYADGWLGSSNLWLAASNGLTYVRANFLFDATREYTDAVHDYDAVVENAAAAGATILPVLIKTNQGTPGGLDVSSPEERARWERFAAQLAMRYGPNGTFWSEHEGVVPYQPIRAWEIWNEPNLEAFGDVKPKAFRVTLRLARRGLRGVDPEARIVLGGLSFAGEAMRYLEDVVSTKSARCLFDAVAIHPYGATPKEAFGLIERTVERLRDLGLQGKHAKQDVSVWITEVGWAIAGPTWPLCVEQQGGKCVKKAAFTVPDAETQAAYMAELAERIDERRAAWRIGPTIWYAYADLPPSPSDPDEKWWRHCGLVDGDAVWQTGVPRPSFWRAAEIAAERPTVPLPHVRCP